MNIAEAKQQVKDAVEAYFEKDSMGLYRIDPVKQRPLFLLGAPGIGKTAIMSQIANELGIGLVSYSMTHHTRQSALGLPFIVHRNYEGFEYDASEYTMSEIVSAIYDFMQETGIKRGILFLDEINCVSETLYPSMLQFLQFKTFGRHRIPEDWAVVCAGNPPEYNKSVHEFDVVTLDRLRKLEIQPDYKAWHDYAINQGIHPAILSFLEIKKDCFYLVESTPSGKTFVTARGWEDLSELITLFEAAGKTVDKTLIEQFLQNDDIAERFALYYELFSKYRSDYQVDRILAGAADDEVAARAKDAKFDERLALIGLMLDAVSGDAKDCLRAEAAVLGARDVLREARRAIADEGASIDEALLPAIREREQAAKEKHARGTISPDDLRTEQAVIAALKRVYAGCAAAGATGGKGALASIGELYSSQVADLQIGSEAVKKKIDCAYRFLDGTFDEARETVVFTTELTARKATSAFIGKFGCDSYYAHNDTMLTQSRESALKERIDILGAGDLSLGDAMKPVAEPVAVAEPIAPAKPEATPAAAPEAREVAEPEAAPAASKRPSRQELADFYSRDDYEYGFASLCRMVLPGDLWRKRVLDVGCRRGKGVFKLSSRVGGDGYVLGIDSSHAYIAEAQQKMDRAWRESGLPHNNMEFRMGYPEDLEAAGAEPGTFDMVFSNSVLNLGFDARLACEEVFKALKPGGLFVCQTVVAEGERDASVVAGAREIGNAIQAAPSRADFLSWLADAGFGKLEFVEELGVFPQFGAETSHEVETVPSNEDIRFTAVVIHATKPE